jgi:hypothetical protein
LFWQLWWTLTLVVTTFWVGMEQISATSLLFSRREVLSANDLWVLFVSLSRSIMQRARRFLLRYCTACSSLHKDLPCFLLILLSGTSLLTVGPGPGMDH